VQEQVPLLLQVPEEAASSARPRLPSWANLNLFDVDVGQVDEETIVVVHVSFPFLIRSWVLSFGFCFGPDRFGQRGHGAESRGRAGKSVGRQPQAVALGGTQPRRVPEVLFVGRQDLPASGPDRVGEQVQPPIFPLAEGGL